MANSTSVSSHYRSVGNIQLVYRCNLPVRHLTSNTKDNPFRRFYKCRNNQCDTWEWMDDVLPMRVKRGIVKQMDQIESLKKELDTVQGRLQAKDTKIWILTLVIIVLIAMLILK
ncbi:hypothetical protein Dimus_033474 [Dionaea muscipula]